MYLTSGLVFALLACASLASTITKDDDAIPAVEPDYLDMLLKEGRFDEFEYLMDIPVAGLSKPNEEIEKSDEDAMMNPNLPEGDILYTSDQAEEVRQGIRFDRRPSARWPGNPAIVPYTISNGFPSSTRQRIQNAIRDWNNKVKCVKFNPRRSESSYAMFFRGNGCYANLGRTGRQQSISIGNGCERHGTILHEMDHTVGFAHEHNRNDRDNFVRVLWENIPPNWRSQYQKTNPRDFGTQANYDYYSMMHYGMRAPGTGRPAFQILKNGIDENRIGQRVGFTDTDLQKITILYGC